MNLESHHRLRSLGWNDFGARVPLEIDRFLAWADFMKATFFSFFVLPELLNGRSESILCGPGGTNL